MRNIGLMVRGNQVCCAHWKMQREVRVSIEGLICGALPDLWSREIRVAIQLSELRKEKVNEGSSSG